MSLTFVVNGREMTEQELRAKAPPAPKRVSHSAMTKVDERSIATHSLGFIVSGYPPLEIAQAKVEYERAAEAEVGKTPEPFTLMAYAKKHKPTKARRRPFEVESAADDCAALLMRQGWHMVSVQELLRFQAKTGT
jgi:hypothetical protein